MTATAGTRPSARLRIPDAPHAVLRIGRREVQLTNLDKVFWPRPGLTKRDLLQYYADVAAVLLPHLRDRAMVMKRYPNGIHGKCFFMKRTPSPRPDWIETCGIMHDSGNLLDPVKGATFDRVRRTAVVVRDELAALGMRPLVKTSGSKGLHLYVPIVRGPVQKEVWRFAKQLAKRLAQEHPALITAEYRIADRPRGRVLVDYNQNAWGRTLASIYSVRPTELATVSAPVTHRDLWKPLLRSRGRFRLEEVL